MVDLSKCRPHSLKRCAACGAPSFCQYRSAGVFAPPWAVPWFCWAHARQLANLDLLAAEEAGGERAEEMRYWHTAMRGGIGAN